MSRMAFAVWTVNALAVTFVFGFYLGRNWPK